MKKLLVSYYVNIFIYQWNKFLISQLIKKKTPLKKKILFFLKKTNKLQKVKIAVLNLLNFTLHSINFFQYKFLNVLLSFIKESKISFIKENELELKGVNYWFTKLKSNILLELGYSHLHVFHYYFFNFFLGLKKKKIKKIIFITFNKYYFSSCINQFRYTLKSVGPYKLKGFLFYRERLALKEGKKPFK